MSGIKDSIFKKGYYPLAANNYGGISWRGEELHGFWMWNGKYNEYEGGVRHVQTVRVREMKEAALRYWRDGWVPLKPVDEGFLRRMEAALRGHRGLKGQGIRFPDTPFLKLTDPIPEEHLSPEAREYLGLPCFSGDKKGKLVRRDRLSKKIIEAYRKTKEAVHG